MNSNHRISHQTFHYDDTCINEEIGCYYYIGQCDKSRDIANIPTLNIFIKICD